MLKSKVWMLGLLAMSGSFTAQDKLNNVPRPKLVVGLVVDQMRWDYLYRYYSKYEEGGFKRMLNTGYSLNNVHIDYIPTYTAIGHTSIFTGSVPSIHGIAGNNWYDRETGDSAYCTEDKTVQPVGTSSLEMGQHSPRNLWSTTVTDELRMATNFEAKVVGVSLKDRASILPAGHNPTAAFWFDDTTGDFISSSYYMKDLPQWAKDFNKQKYPSQLIAKGWNTLLPIKEYTESSADNVAWEDVLGSKKTPTFPYSDLAKDYEKKKGIIRTTPYGNTLSLLMADAAIDGYQLGADEVTDFLTVNLASTDYVGHNFGPNSIEVEDTYIRLDRDLAKFFSTLDQKIGKGNYTVFLSADHGGAHSVGFMQENKMPAGFSGDGIKKELNTLLQNKFGVEKLVLASTNNQVYLNKKAIKEKDLSYGDVMDMALEYLRDRSDILYASDMEELTETSIPEPIKTRAINGYNWKRSGDIQYIPKDGYISSYAKKGTTHGAWNSYDSHIPLIFMGWGIQKGESNKAYHMTDIAPTVSALLKIQFPSGAIGQPITEVLGK
ncbi:alkaline phosphatase PafA [Elizabethkingia sp. JS20170427COW]|uniref:alkaline phosphatase PafA n=1 Tax=Elizabethkingia sp. JS20170427COW TaxID=2583851 RepID=UPI001110932B|nr:alkaline phosphatase PafA [Elizabethkingia sp. JS20170427COW]QCX52809.1 alkaline phosphatase family protein [Elizabethkingia sp. JS20170427COW]